MVTFLLQLDHFLHSIPFLRSSTPGSRLVGVIAGVSGLTAAVRLRGERTGCDGSEGKTHHLLLGDVGVTPSPCLLVR